jgi:hypothetical protein
LALYEKAEQRYLSRKQKMQSNVTLHAGAGADARILVENPDFQEHIVTGHNKFANRKNTFICCLILTFSSFLIGGRIKTVI